jgi:hypothetical protein
VAWIVRLVKTAVDGEEQCVDVMTISRPDDLSDIANFGLTLAEGKRLLAGLQQEIVAALVHFQTKGKMAPNPNSLCDGRLTTDGIRASGCQHPVQHRDTDSGLGLLGRKAASVQPWPDQRLITIHSRFY